MATIDNYTIKVGVDGAPSLEQLNTSLGNIEKSSKQTAQVLNSFNIRNVAYQIQDIAVQAEMGTNAFRIFTQQAPQLLSAFGTVGAVIGAVAAVGLPLLQYGLKLAGYDARSLTERLTALTQAADEFKKAQEANLSSVQGLQFAFGSLSEEAKKFYEVQQELTKKNAYNELNSSLSELDSKFKIFRQDNSKPFFTGNADVNMGIGISNAFESLYKYWKQTDLGLTAEQAAHIGEAMKDIDKKKPAEAAETLRQISEYLDTSTTISDKFKRTWSETIAPILKANNAILELEKNVKAAGEATSALSTTLMNMQAGSIVNVGNAKRDFDQIKAIGLDAAEKIKEFNVQANQKSSQDGVDREKEKAAFANKTNAERINAEKDFYKAQQETYYAQQLSNEATDRSLRAQVSINKLKLEQLDSINYEKILEESRVNNVVKEQNALLANVELRRKNLITADELKKLDEQAHENRLTNDKIAQQDAERIQKTNERNIRIQIEGLDMANKERLKSLQLEESSFGLSTRQQAFQKQLLDLQNARTRAIKDLNNNAALSDQEKLDALIGINEQYQISKDLAQQELDFRTQLDDNFKAGLQDRAKAIAESFTPFKVAGSMVDAVYNDMGSALDKFVETGKLSFSDLARSIIIDLEKIALKSAVIGVFKAMGIGDIFSLPGKAAGGPVNAGQAYMVGEGGGPEMFIPNTSGTIVPNNRLGSSGGMGGNTYITNNISAIDSRSVSQLFAEHRQTLFGNVEQARRELPLRTR